MWKFNFWFWWRKIFFRFVVFVAIRINVSLHFREFVMGTAVEDMLVGCLWQGESIIVVSVSGHISYLDRQNPGKPWKVVKV